MILPFIGRILFEGKENTMSTNLKAKVDSMLLGIAFDDGIGASISISKLSAYDLPR